MFVVHDDRRRPWQRARQLARPRGGAATRGAPPSARSASLEASVEIETLVTRGCVSGPEHDGSDRAPSGPSCGAAAREGLPTVDPFDQICRT